MSLIAVVGGGGTVGRRIVDALAGAGHETRVLSRSSSAHPVDLTTGAGLDTALTGCEVVVDASNGSPIRPEPVIVQGAERLVRAAAGAGVGHYVCVSIVGIERVPTRYYRAKVAQENVVRAGRVPWSIVRSTQFHELVETLFAGLGRWRLSPRSGARLQPVAALEAARLVADVAGRVPSGATATIAGPEVRTVTELADGWSEKRAPGRRLAPLPVVFAPRFARPLKAGALTCDEPDIRGGTPFGAWLAAGR